MALSSFRKGIHIQIKGTSFVMRREVSKGIWQLEDENTGRLETNTLKELERIYENGELIFFNETLATYKTAIKDGKIITVRPDPEGPQWEKAKIRRFFVRAIEELPSTRSLVEPAIQALNRKHNLLEETPHWGTVVRWKNRYLENGNDAFSLVAKNHEKGNRKSSFGQEVRDFVEDAIHNHYLTRERVSMALTLAYAQTKTEDENRLRPAGQQLKIPTSRFLKCVLDNVPAFDRHAARYGRTAAMNKFRTKLKHTYTKRRLQKAEIDHTRLDLFILSEDGKTPIGRPWVTACIDVHTRCILGIYIGFEPPSYLSVARCLKHAFLPKTYLRERYPDIKNEWLAYGVMDELIVDNGLEFHSDSLEKACYAFGIEITYTPRKSPWWKGKIERFMRTFNEGVSYGVQGTTFSNIFEKDDYDPMKHAVVTMETLQIMVHKWIADVYHQRPHHGLDHVPPAVMWESSKNSIGDSLAADPAIIDVILGKAHIATIGNSGIQVNKLFYNSWELNEIRRQYGHDLKVDIRIDQGDVGHIHVKHPDDSGYFEVPALRADYAKGVSLWLHKLYCSFAVKHYRKDDVPSWVRASVDIRNIIERDTVGNRGKTNSHLGRYEEATPERVSKPVKKAVSKAKAMDTAPIALDMPYSEISLPVARRSYAPVIEQRSK